MALDRLVSVSDCEGFARARSGIGKASTLRLSDGTGTLVHLTIAGTDDTAIEPSSDLFRNLRLALQRFSDPALPVQVAVRELVLLVIAAGVAVHPDHHGRGRGRGAGRPSRPLPLRRPRPRPGRPPG